MIRDEQQRQRPRGYGDAHEPDAVRRGVRELHGEDDELVLAAQPLQHPQVARADRVRRDDLVIEDGDSHVTRRGMGASPMFIGLTEAWARRPCHVKALGPPITCELA